jgi:hypothetical protein
MPKIKVKIDRAGRPQFTPEGFKGDACLNATKGLENLMSLGSVKNRTLTDEYYEGGGKKEAEVEAETA